MFQSPKPARGEEVLINYGAKGNGELLRAHGFVIDNNLADVLPLDLGPLLPSRRFEVTASEGSAPHERPWLAGGRRERAPKARPDPL